MPRWPSDWLGLSPEASHTARVAGSHRTNGFVFSNTVELGRERMTHCRQAARCGISVDFPVRTSPVRGSRRRVAR
ncbi:hypothetical protein BRL95_13230 [Xanthomonas oryzae pv. oryzae]|nr:hypothetical protein BRL95_13230 [Xanthomonas oryzae pv. oryzae]